LKLKPGRDACEPRERDCIRSRAVEGVVCPQYLVRVGTPVVVDR
jgi:hypothetical protein